MWKVSSINTIKIDHNPERNFPIALGLDFDGDSWGMWLDVDDAKYVVHELKAAIKKCAKSGAPPTTNVSRRRQRTAAKQ